MVIGDPSRLRVVQESPVSGAGCNLRDDRDAGPQLIGDGFHRAHQFGREWWQRRFGGLDGGGDFDFVIGDHAGECNGYGQRQKMRPIAYASLKPPQAFFYCAKCCLRD